MLTTLYCDASFCHRTRAGGWGIWLRSERGRHVESGPTPDYCTASSEAELAAIFAGIYRAATMWPETEAILVRSDCETALHWMARRYEARCQGGQRLVTRIEQVKTKYDLRTIPRWVKGHRIGNWASAYLNNRVDQMAHAEMRRERRRVET